MTPAEWRAYAREYAEQVARSAMLSDEPSPKRWADMVEAERRNLLDRLRSQRVA